MQRWSHTSNVGSCLSYSLYKISSGVLSDQRLSSSLTAPYRNPVRGEESKPVSATWLDVIG
jgi:hypothetical protein